MGGTTFEIPARRRRHEGGRRSRGNKRGPVVGSWREIQMPGEVGQHQSKAVAAFLDKTFYRTSNATYLGRERKGFLSRVSSGVAGFPECL
jgi:hypothetical protein